MPWTRPSDWPAMPAAAVNFIDILAAVTDDDSNFCAVSATVTGGYTVDWGDGTVENVTSGTQIDHKYTYATLGTAVTSRGYKTAIIRIYPQSGGNIITAFDIGRKNATSGLASYSNPWLDIQVNAPDCTSMSYRGGVDCMWCERINILALGAVTALASTFQNCYSLQSIAFPSGSLASVTDTTSLFVADKNLEKIVNCAIPVSFSVSGNMASAELNSLYTSLPTVTSKTLTVSGNYGYAASTKSIATGKGWTLS